MITNLRGSQIIAFNNAAIRFLNPETGEVVGECDLQPGPQSLDGFAPLGVNHLVEIDQVFQVRTPGGRLSVMSAEDRFETAASLTYTPSIAEEQEALIRSLVNRITEEQRVKEEAKTRRQAKRKDKRRDKPALPEPAPTEDPGNQPPFDPEGEAEPKPAEKGGTDA